MIERGMIACAALARAWTAVKPGVLLALICVGLAL